MPDGRGGGTAEESFAQVEEREIEAAQGAESKEDGGVSGGIVDGGGDVGDLDGVCCADWDVDLVVAGAWGEGLIVGEPEVERAREEIDRVL